MQITRIPSVDIQLAKVDDFNLFVSKYQLPVFIYNDMGQKQSWSITIYQSKVVGVNVPL